MTLGPMMGTFVVQISSVAVLCATVVSCAGPQAQDAQIRQAEMIALAEVWE